ncbi:hypothetical protein D3C71_1823300 [compost metagenome]
MLEVGKAVRHVGLARQERLFPKDLAAAQDPRRASDILRRCADTDFRPEARLAQLRVGEPEIVDPLGLVVGKLVGNGKADAERHALVGDHVNAGHFRLLAAVFGKGRRDER